MKSQYILVVLGLFLSISSAFSKENLNSADYSVLAKRHSIALYSDQQRKNSFDGCKTLFPGNNPDGIIGSYTDVRSVWKLRKLCSDNFAVLYSDQTKTPLLVIEKLNAKDLNNKSEGLKRMDVFYSDPRTPTNGQAKISDFRNAKPSVDKGHLAPAGNALTAKGMAQTFALSNMIPQDSNNNRQAWKKIETDVRKYISRSKMETYIITGVLFDKKENSTKLGKNKVWKPTRIFKLVYNTANEKKSWVYIVNNEPTTVPQPISYDQFVDKTGVRFGFLETGIEPTAELGDTPFNNLDNANILTDKISEIVKAKFYEILQNFIQYLISNFFNE